MSASHIKMLKSSVNLKEFFRGTYEKVLLFHDHFLFLDNKYAANDAVPSTRIHGSQFKLFVSIFGKLEEIIKPRLQSVFFLLFLILAGL